MVYDPNKMYSWNPEDKFVLSGKDFGLILNSLRFILSSEKAQQIILAAKANEALEAILKEGVENGTVFEKEQPKTE